jgi:pimeloyl-ACP methyl ester carboxylesterase
MGGMIAQEFALTYPETATMLILRSTFCSWPRVCDVTILRTCSGHNTQ